MPRERFSHFCDSSLYFLQTECLGGARMLPLQICTRTTSPPLPCSASGSSCRNWPTEVHLFFLSLSFFFLFLPHLVQMSLYFLFSSPCPSCTRVIVLSWQLPLCEAARTSQGVSLAGPWNKNRLFDSRLDASGQPIRLVFASFKVKRRQSLSSRLVNGCTRVCNKLQHLQSAAAAPSV